MNNESLKKLLESAGTAVDTIGQNRVGRDFDKIPDLSHHRAYGSVHGGSINLTSNTPFGVVI